MRTQVEAVRDMMRSRGWDAVVLTGNDPHSSEYSAPRWHQVAWVSGYTGEGEMPQGTLQVDIVDVASTSSSGGAAVGTMNGTTGGTTRTTSAVTGDTSPILPLIALMALAAAVIAIVVLGRKKNRR